LALRFALRRADRIRRLDLVGWFIGGSLSCLQLHERAQKRPTIQPDELPDPVAVDGCLAASVIVDLGTTITGGGRVGGSPITGKISTDPNPDISLTL